MEKKHIRRAMMMFLMVGFFVHDIKMTAGEENLIANHSVEMGVGGYPESWSREKSGNNTSVFYNRAEGQDGERALQIVVTKYIAGFRGGFLILSMRILGRAIGIVSTIKLLSLIHI